MVGGWFWRLAWSLFEETLECCITKVVSLFFYILIPELTKSFLDSTESLAPSTSPQNNLVYLTKCHEPCDNSYYPHGTSYRVAEAGKNSLHLGLKRKLDLKRWNPRTDLATIQLLGPLPRCKLLSCEASEPDLRYQNPSSLLIFPQFGIWIHLSQNPMHTEPQSSFIRSSSSPTSSLLLTNVVEESGTPEESLPEYP